jgi:hypothetical protein
MECVRVDLFVQVERLLVLESFRAGVKSCIRLDGLFGQPFCINNLRFSATSASTPHMGRSSRLFFEGEVQKDCREKKKT